MKLEQKIIPYLAYEVEYCYKKPSYRHSGFTYEKRGVLTTKGNIHNINNILHSLGKDYFLLLRPLSDLTKEIEVNGEKFVPIEEFEKAGYIFPLNEDNFHNLPYGIVNILLKWHFDIFEFIELIENSLAIDINTL